MGKRASGLIVRLTARDTRVFEDLLARRAETLGNLHHRHWPHAARDTARRRLGMLAAAGYLHRNPVQHTPGTLVHPSDEGRTWLGVYTLTPKAIAALRRRSLAGSQLRGRSVNVEVNEAAIPHQLTVNRVGELIGANLTTEHLLDLAGDRRHRPDATYLAEPNRQGAATIMLEVDLGHYNRQRILGKLRTFLADPDAKGVLFACPTTTRAAWIARTLRAAHGDRIMDRVQVLSFAQLHDGELLRDDLRPHDQGESVVDDAYTRLPRTA